MTNRLENPFLYLNPYQNSLSDKIEVDSVYIHISNLKIKNNRKRPLYKIINPENNKSVIRKLRGKSSIKIDEITFDRMTTNELVLKSETVIIKPANKLEQYTIYFWYHPKEDIGIAYKFFLAGIIIGVFSVILGIVSLCK